MKLHPFNGIAIALVSAGCVATLISVASDIRAQEPSKPIRAAQINQSSPSMPPTVAEPPTTPTAAECDANCVRRSADSAAQACVPLIEAKAPLDYDWLSRPFGGMFTQAEQPGGDGIVRYRGDGIRVLTGQNQWLRHAYECAYDPVQRKIVGVELRPGRLVPPADVAQFITSILKNQPGAQVSTQPIAKDGKMPQKQAAATPAAKPKPRYGEPGLIYIGQARLHTAQIDSSTRISQSGRSARRRSE